MTLNVIYDCSGSFCFRGKKNLPSYAYNMMKSLSQRDELVRETVDYYFWQEDVLDKLSNSDKLMNLNGRSNYYVLADFLKEKSKIGEPCILLTDGCFDSWNVLSELSEICRKNVVIVLLGSDADWQLAEMCGIGLYSLADLPAAVNHQIIFNTIQERDRF